MFTNQLLHTRVSALIVTGIVLGLPHPSPSKHRTDRSSQGVTSLHDTRPQSFNVYVDVLCNRKNRSKNCPILMYRKKKHTCMVGIWGIVGMDILGIDMLGIEMLGSCTPLGISI